MSYLTFTLKHGMTLEDARGHLRKAVGEVCTRFKPVVQQVDWSGDGSGVKITGRGFDIDMRVDAQDLHVAGNLAFLGGLLSGPFATGLKQILQRTFPRRLT